MRRQTLLLLTFLLIAGQVSAQEAPPGENPGGQPLKKSSFSLEQFESGTYSKEQIEKMASIAATRRSMIEKLEKLLRDQPLYPRKAEVYFRLGELYWEQAKYEYLVARSKFDKAAEAFENKVGPAPGAEPKEDVTVALGWYRKVIQEFPDYERLDEVLYYIGKGALQQGRDNQDRNLLKEAVQYLQRLVQNYPQSRLLPQGFLALGEYFFETDSLYYAKTNYEKIISGYPNAPMFNYALYKLGWVYFNLREFRKTIETFQKVVENIGTATGQVSFRDQALNDLVKTWAEMDDSWREALDYFQTVLKGQDDEIWDKMETLASLYVGFDKDREALELYNHFIETRPMNGKVPSWFARLIEVRRKANDFAETEKEMQRACAYFNPEGSWVKANSENTEAMDEALGMCEASLHELANYWHQAADKATEKKQDAMAAELYPRAAKLYEDFLRLFPNSKRSYHNAFYLAEIKYGRLKDFPGAIKWYQWVITKDDQGEFVEDAALGVIYAAYEEMCKQGIRECTTAKGGIEKKKLSEDEYKKEMNQEIAVTELHPLEQAYVGAADSYVNLLLRLRKDPEFVKKYPKRGEQIPEVMYLSADTYYKHGKFADAVDRLQKIFDYDPKSKMAPVAAVTIMQAYSRLNRWEKVEEWARKLKASRNAFITDEQANSYIVIALSERATQLLKAKRTDEAIGLYKQLLTEFGKSKDKDMISKATYNLAFLYERAKRTKEAVQTYESIVKSFPKEAVAPEAQFQIGVLYESQTRFAESAEAFLLMEKFKANKDAPDAIINASLIREATGDAAGAIAALEKFQKLFPTHERAPMTFFKIGVLLEKLGDPKSLKKAVAHYDAFANKHPSQHALKVEGWSRAGDILRKLDEADQAAKNAKNPEGAPVKKVYTNRKKASDYFIRSVSELGNALKEAEGKPEKKGGAQWYAAQSAYWLADYVFQEFDDTKIPATMNINALKEALIKKATLHSKAEVEFQKVWDMGSSYWLGCAAYRNGRLYYDFVKELDAVPVPDMLLGTEGETQYKAALQTIADPINEKALLLLKGALEVAHEKGVYNQCAKEAGIYASRVNPDGYPVAGDSPLNKQLSAEHTQDTLLSANVVRYLRRGDVTVDMLKFVKKDQK